MFSITHIHKDKTILKQSYFLMLIYVEVKIVGVQM